MTDRQSDEVHLTVALVSQGKRSCVRDLECRQTRLRDGAMFGAKTLRLERLFLLTIGVSTLSIACCRPNAF